MREVSKVNEDAVFECFCEIDERFREVQRSIVYLSKKVNDLCKDLEKHKAWLQAHQI
jgi:hypothetical protein